MILPIVEKCKLNWKPCVNILQNELPELAHLQHISKGWICECTDVEGKTRFNLWQSDNK